MIYRFTSAERAILWRYYHEGMKGIGKVYVERIEAAANEADLSSQQVMVCTMSLIAMALAVHFFDSH